MSTESVDSLYKVEALTTSHAEPRGSLRLAGKKREKTATPILTSGKTNFSIFVLSFFFVRTRTQRDTYNVNNWLHKN